jgi:hypothetical protein
VKIVKCDVCGEDYQPGDDMIEMVIPASFVDEEGEGIAIDVCGWPCVSAVVDSALRAGDQTPDGDEEPDSEPEEKAFIAVPKVPTIDTTMDEQTLAHFTEQVTGVKRR